MTDLDKRLASLSPEKRALLMKQLSKKMPAKQRLEITPRERPARLPLSFAQQRLWILDQFEPDSATYNVPFALTMKGKPNIQILEKAINEIINRHEILRTTIQSDDLGPVQSIHATKSLKIEIHLLADIEPSERHSEAHKIALQEAKKPFNISEDILIRCALIHISESEFLFVMNAHHIAVDGWSYNVIFNELTQLYSAYYQQLPSPLPVLEIQYADYTLWQQELLQEGSETLSRQLGYWQQKLSGQLPVLALPTDRARPAVRSNKGEAISYYIDVPIVNSLRQLSQQHNVTLFMAFAAAFQVLLYRYSRQTDIIIGVGVANRGRQEIENLIGFFVNTLAVRFDLSGDPSFQQILERVKEEMLGADAHQDIPVERLMEVLEIDRSMSHPPLFQTMLFFQNFPAQDILLPEVTLSPVDPESMSAGVSRSDIALFAAEEEGKLRLYFEYSSELFDTATIRNMAVNLEQIIISAVASPSENISQLNLLTAEDRNTLLLDRNANTLAISPETNMSQLFNHQVNSSPDAIAIAQLTNQLTYRQLDYKSSNLAAQLIDKGVGAGNFVGLYMNRSIDMMVGLLAILKTGAAYLPLDPNYPDDRISFMISDSNTRLVLSESSLQTQLVEILNEQTTEIIAIDEINLSDTVFSDAATSALANIKISTNSVAYSIYTSGTTGRPKGVLIPHSALANFLLSMTEQPGINSSDIVCAVTTLSFDISILELLLPLTVGAKVVIVASEVAADAALLAQMIKTSQATLMQATPTTWQMLLESGWQGKPDLKILSGGESLSRTLANKLLHCGKELWNMYGPTETTIWSTIKKIDSLSDNVTVGKPIANTQVYVLDEKLQLVPDGVIGELYIGGQGVAAGYLNRVELTAEKFINSPFARTSTQRLYRTGDLACWLRNGELKILGRIDHQVKMRGFRIELSEIQSVINLSEKINDSIVICREDREDDKRLVAYLIAANESEAQVSILEDIRRLMKTNLPEYMQPAAFVFMQNFPLTANGKIDRLNLPQPDFNTIAQSDFVAPRNDEEEILAKLWSEALGLEKISIDADFFQLGGHSLLATQLISKIRKQFSSDASLRVLFEAPSVAEFAEYLMDEKINSFDQSALNGMLDQLEGLSSEDLETLLANEEL